MEIIINKIRCFIWKREFVFGSGFLILLILKVIILVDEIVMEKMYIIFMFRIYVLLKFFYVKVK